MTVCCSHNRCPDRPRRFLRRFRNRPWYCNQCGRLWVTVGHGVQHPDGGMWWEWKDLTVADPTPPSRITLAPTAGEQTLTNKLVVTPGTPITVSAPGPAPGITLTNRATGITTVNGVLVADAGPPIGLYQVSLGRLWLTRAGTEGEQRWRKATDDRDTTRFRVTANIYPHRSAEKTIAVCTWTGTRQQITEMAQEYALDTDNPLLHMEIGTVEVLPENRTPLVHNHGPEEGRGLACRERTVDGRQVGACLPDAPTYREDDL